MNYRSLFGNILAALLLTSTAVSPATAQQPTSTNSVAQDNLADEPEEKPVLPKFALSVNAGLTFSYTDVKPSKSAPTFGIAAAYHATPYLRLHLDLQKGWLKGGEAVTDASKLMGSDNSFIAAALSVRFLPLGLIDNKSNNEALNIFSGLYGGIGLGFISNSVDANKIASPDYGSLGEYSGASAMMPIEAGIDIPVLKMTGNRRLLINLNYRINLCFSDKIDGYVPIVEANKKNDAYNSLTVGLVYNF